MFLLQCLSRGKLTCQSVCVYCQISMWGLECQNLLPFTERDARAGNSALPCPSATTAVRVFVYMCVCTCVCVCVFVLSERLAAEAELSV